MHGKCHICKKEVDEGELFLINAEYCSEGIKHICLKCDMEVKRLHSVFRRLQVYWTKEFLIQRKAGKADRCEDLWLKRGVTAPIIREG